MGQSTACIVRIILLILGLGSATTSLGLYVANGCVLFRLDESGYNAHYNVPLCNLALSVLHAMPYTLLILQAWD